MKHRTSAMLAAAFLALSSPALAQAFDLKGTYGVSGGCEFGKGEDALRRGMSILTNDTFRAGDVSCQILQALPAKNDAYVATMLCERGGENRTTIDQFRLSKVTAEIGDIDAYELSDATGKLLGRLDRCAVDQ